MTVRNTSRRQQVVDNGRDSWIDTSPAKGVWRIASVFSCRKVVAAPAQSIRIRAPHSGQAVRTMSGRPCSTSVCDSGRLRLRHGGKRRTEWGRTPSCSPNFYIWRRGWRCASVGAHSMERIGTAALRRLILSPGIMDDARRLRVRAIGVAVRPVSVQAPSPPFPRLRSLGWS
jgi:hypothetical protein